MLKELQAYFSLFGLEVVPIQDNILPRYQWQVAPKGEDGLNCPVFCGLKDILPWWKEQHRSCLLRDKAIDFLLSEYASGDVEKCRSIDAWVDGSSRGVYGNPVLSKMWRTAFAMLRSEELPPALRYWKAHMLRQVPLPDIKGDISPLSVEAFTHRRTDLERQRLQKRLRRSHHGAKASKRI